MLATLRCPRCGQQARGTVETVPGIARLSFAADGTAEYDGETELYWDGQETVHNPAGQVLLQCPEGYEWFTEVSLT